jgi:hypothetical protein
MNRKKNGFGEYNRLLYNSLDEAAWPSVNAAGSGAAFSSAAAARGLPRVEFPVGRTLSGDVLVVVYHSSRKKPLFRANFHTSFLDWGSTSGTGAGPAPSPHDAAAAKESKSNGEKTLRLYLNDPRPGGFDEIDVFDRKKNKPKFPRGFVVEVTFGPAATQSLSKPAPPPVKKGWLWKRGGWTNPSWKKRLFVLQRETGILRYFAGETGPPRGALRLVELAVQAEAPEETRKGCEHCFRLARLDGGRVFVLRAKTEAERAEWCGALREARRRALEAEAEAEAETERVRRRAWRALFRCPPESQRGKGAADERLPLDDDFRTLLSNFYRVFNPKKIDDVDRIIEGYRREADGERKLLADLQNKYSEYRGAK